MHIYIYIIYILYMIKSFVNLRGVQGYLTIEAPKHRDQEVHTIHLDVNLYWRPCSKTIKDVANFTRKELGCERAGLPHD